MHRDRCEDLTDLQMGVVNSPQCSLLPSIPTLMNSPPWTWADPVSCSSCIEHCHCNVVSLLRHIWSILLTYCCSLTHPEESQLPLEKLPYFHRARNWVNNWNLSPTTCKELNSANQHTAEPGSSPSRWRNEWGPSGCQDCSVWDTWTSTQPSHMGRFLTHRKSELTSGHYL